jgi:hypothetical protein
MVTLPPVASPNGRHRSRRASADDDDLLAEAFSLTAGVASSGKDRQRTWRRMTRINSDQLWRKAIFISALSWNIKLAFIMLARSDLPQPYCYIFIKGLLTA